MSIDQNDPRRKPVGGLMLPPPVKIPKQNAQPAQKASYNPKMRQVPVKIPPTPELKAAKGADAGLRTGVVAQSTSEKVGEMGEIVKGMENNAQYIEQNTAGNVQKIGTFESYEEKAKQDPAYIIQAAALNIAANYAGHKSKENGWSVQLKESKGPALDKKVEKFEIQKPVEAEEKQDLALDLRKLKKIKKEREEKAAPQIEKTRNSEEQEENPAEKPAEEEGARAEEREKEALEEKKTTPVQEEIEIPQEESVEAPEKNPEEIEGEAQKSQNIKNEEIEKAAGEPKEKVIEEMQIPKNALASALNVKPRAPSKERQIVSPAKKNEKPQNTEIRKTQDMNPGQMQKKPQEAISPVDKVQNRQRINPLAQALKKAPWFSKKPQAPVQDKEREVSPQEVYALKVKTERKHEGILEAAENAQEAKIGENIKEQITDLAIKADDIYEKTGENLKSVANAQKYLILQELEAGLQKIENQIRARWPEVKFA